MVRERTSVFGDSVPPGDPDDALRAGHMNSAHSVLLGGVQYPGLIAVQEC